MIKQIRRPFPVGVFFKEEILEERGISITKAAESLGITRKTLSLFVNGRSRCSPTMAKRLAEATGTGVGFWINMQANLDTWEAENIVLETRVSPLSVDDANYVDEIYLFGEQL